MSQTTRQGGDQLFPGRAAVAVLPPPHPPAVQQEGQAERGAGAPEPGGPEAEASAQACASFPMATQRARGDMVGRSHPRHKHGGETESRAPRRHPSSRQQG